MASNHILLVWHPSCCICLICIHALQWPDILVIKWLLLPFIWWVMIITLKVKQITYCIISLNCLKKANWNVKGVCNHMMRSVGVDVIYSWKQQQYYTCATLHVSCGRIYILILNQRSDLRRIVYFKIALKARIRCCCSPSLYMTKARSDFCMYLRVQSCLTDEQTLGPSPNPNWGLHTKTHARTHKVKSHSVCEQTEDER